jgi:Domain of unknown function (DUF4136)
VRSRTLLLGVLAAFAGLALAGCDDRVAIDRDSSIPIRRGMTWAWRPAGAEPVSHRRVVSRDAIGRSPYDRGPSYERNADWDNDIVKNRLARAFERNLSERGLVQVSDPGSADFLVDYQFAVARRRERVATPVYSSGLVCGYYGCWNGFWGPPGVVVHTVHYREGTIVFDLVDHNLNRLAYRAVRENVVTRKSFTDDELNEGVKHLLKGLKPTK